MKHRYKHNNTGPIDHKQRAIVIGGGISGLLASRVLANHFDEVLVLDRDQYPKEPGVRAGVPQARHVHILLLRGKEILDNLFPGLGNELIDKGAASIRMGDELAVLNYHGWRVKYPGGLTLITFTLPLLEACIRSRIAKWSKVKIKEHCRVTSLIIGNDGKRITGVRCQGTNESATERALFADFIVDARGRFSNTPEWLTEMGFNPPEETMVDPCLGYASRMYEVPDVSAIAQDHWPGWKGMLLLGKPPDHTRGGVLLPVEGHRWHVTLVGINKDYPSTSETGFLEFAGTLRSDMLYQTIKNAKPLTPVASYRATGNRRRHYDRLSQWPGQFVVMGDALCAFNPVYGQGISVAAMQALAMDECFHIHKHADDISKRIQRKLSKVIDTPWLMATSDDARWQATIGADFGLYTRLMHKYIDTVMALGTEHPEIDKLFASVAHLIKPNLALFHPGLAVQVIRRMIFSDNA